MPRTFSIICNAEIKSKSIFISSTVEKKLRQALPGADNDITKMLTKAYFLTHHGIENGLIDTVKLSEVERPLIN